MIKMLSFADIISISNALLGFFAITIPLSDFLWDSDLRLRVSFSLILIGILLDGVDGMIARKYGGSEIGIYLDSMADMTSLAIAPGFFVYFIYSDIVSCCPARLLYILVALLFFIGAALIRLASFHIMKNKNYFVGLPVPAACIMLMTLAFLEVEFIVILPVLIISAAAMICDIHFPKFDLKFNAVAFVLIILSLIFVHSFNGLVLWIFFASIMIYSIFGPFYMKFLTKK